MFKILSLDGGGSKGVYTIGVLEELEQKLGGRLHQHFDLVYGTSTGSIIGALICLGESVSTIKEHYFTLIPDIMGRWFRSTRSNCLASHSEKIFGEKKFDAFLTNIGVVATNYDQQKPLIFKSDVKFSHGRKGTFKPGFGCTIREAVEASCAAYPIFNKVEVNTSNQGIVTAIDGGFVANNPTLFAITDAHAALGEPTSNIKVLSVGVGLYLEKPINFQMEFLSKFEIAQLVSTVLTTSSVTNEQISKLLFAETDIIRINDAFLEKKHETNMIEKDKKKLDELYYLGRNSFGKFEREFEKIFLK